MFLLFVIYTDGSFLAPEIPAYFANISQIWVTFTFTLFTKTMCMALYYHLPNSVLNSNVKLSTYFRFTLHESIWKTNYLCFTLMYIKINTE